MIVPTGAATECIGTILMCVPDMALVLAIISVPAMPDGQELSVRPRPALIVPVSITARDMGSA